MALDEAWNELPVWKIRERGWSKVVGWEQAGFDDSEWPTVAALRKEAQMKSDNVLLRAELPPGACAIKYPIPVTGEYMVFVNGQLVEEHIG